MSKSVSIIATSDVNDRTGFTETSYEVQENNDLVMVTKNSVYALQAFLNRINP